MSEVISDRPVWETLPDKPLDAVGNKSCVLLGCNRAIVAKRVCQNHYQAIRLNTLDPITGLTKRERNTIDKEAKIEGEKGKLPVSFRGFDAYVLLLRTAELLEIATGDRFPLHNCVTVWGNWVKDAARAGKFKAFNEEIWNPEPGFSNERYYNSYVPLETLKQKAKEPLCQELEELLENLGGEDKPWLLDWLAYKITHPWECTGALIFHGAQGAGKGTLESVLRAVFGSTYNGIDSISLTQDFNNWADRKFLIVADEVNTNIKYHHEMVRKQLKKYTSPNTLNINKKNVGSYNVRNYASWFIFSNDEKVVDIEEGDRRYSVFKVLKPIKVELGREIGTNASYYGQNLVNALHDREIKHYQYGRPLENAARRTMQGQIKKTQVG